MCEDNPILTEHLPPIATECGEPETSGGIYWLGRQVMLPACDWRIENIHGENMQKNSVWVASSVLLCLCAGLPAPGAYGQPAADATKPVAAAPRASLGETVLPPQPLFIVHLVTGPGWNQEKTASEQAGFREHSQNLARMRNDGRLVMGARYKDSVADKGMLIMRATSKEAVIAEFANDPMVKAKQFVLDIADFQPFYDGFIARPSRTGDAPESPLNALNWLAGCWFGRNDKTEFREHWMRPVGGMMMGMGRTTGGGKLLSYETMRIELDATGTPVFVAKPSAQSEASFKSVKYDATSIQFENLAHDFPQRIKYQLKPDGSLDARIEGTLKGREARIEFPMRRASCE